MRYKITLVVDMDDDGVHPDWIARQMRERALECQFVHNVAYLGAEVAKQKP